MGMKTEGPANIVLRKMTPEDIPFGMILKSQAGWNQLEADWEMLLHEGGDNFIACLDGRNAGTVISFPYEDHFTWIAMVLVDPEARRKGVGKALLTKTLEIARPKGAIRLDATEEGFELYSRLGFRTEYELAMMVRRGSPRSASQKTNHPTGSCSPMTKNDLALVADLDRPIFGADRSRILHGLFQRSPQYAYFLKRNGIPAGYCFGRSGSQYERIGPIIADGPGQAAELLEAAVESLESKDVVIDAFTDKPAWTSCLEKLGFTRQRKLVRMCLGDLHHPGRREKQFASAGPEIG